jgi:hyperosmotically inducible periplasmic protein
MKKIISLTLALPLLIVTPAAMSGCATTQRLGEQTDDLVIKSRVGRRLTADPEVERFDIDVDVMDAVVTLRGEVDDMQSANEAVRLAENTEGVKRVVNKLKIEEYEEDVGIDDDFGIRASVGTRLLADPDVRRINIDVDVIDGVVYLSGVVHDQEAKDAAERIAMKVDGVVRVENELAISPADEPFSTDSAVTQEQQEQGKQGKQGSAKTKDR